MNKKSLTTIVSTLAVIFTSGCDTVRNTFGLDHYQADEFNVSEHPPLSLPPSYNLAPPVAGDTKSNSETQKPDEKETKAKEIILGKEKDTKKQKTNDSKLSKEIVKQAAKDKTVDPEIREKIDSDKEISDTGLENIGNKILENISRTSNEPSDEKSGSQS
jgi:hypothetical protein